MRRRARGAIAFERLNRRGIACAATLRPLVDRPRALAFGRDLMRRRDLNLLVDWCLAPAALIMFATGFVLFFRFHVGHGAFAASAFGVDKLVWLNVHRVTAIAVIAGVMTHVVLHRRAFAFHVIEFVSGRSWRKVDIEPIMYAICLVAALTGLVAWFVVSGSSPLLGPAAVGPLNRLRHAWVDAHNISALTALVLVAHHFGHRWHFMTRGPGARPPLRLRHVFP
jgi:hypothetical protein